MKQKLDLSLILMVFNKKSVPYCAIVNETIAIAIISILLLVASIYKT